MVSLYHKPHYISILGTSHYFVSFSFNIHVYCFQGVPELNEEDEQRVLMSEDSYKEVAGEDGEIDAYELRELLNKTFTPSKKLYTMSLVWLFCICSL